VEKIYILSRDSSQHSAFEKRKQRNHFDRINRIYRTFSQFPASGPEEPTPQRDETEKGFYSWRT